MGPRERTLAASRDESDNPRLTGDGASRGESAGTRPRRADLDHLSILVVFGGGGWLALRGFRWLRQVRRIRAETLGELLALTPQQFEHAVAQLLRDEGYRRSA